MWLCVILIISVFILIRIRLFKVTRDLRIDSLFLEISWTCIPIVVLFSIAIPRLYLLCIQEYFVLSPSFSLKLIRRQWRWQRSFGNLLDHLLDQEGLDKLRDFDSPILLPEKATFRILLTRRDVLHSLGVPGIGIKLDSNPGRLNALFSETSRPSTIWGSCFELCGRGHRAIPVFFLTLI